jgi:bla regulator protein blaR1
MLLFSSITFSGEEIMRALSWTLFHSLWQGVLLSLMAGCIMLLTKKANPLLRYNLLAGALVLFVTGVAATFITQLIHETETVQVSITPASQINIVQSSADIVTAKAKLSVTAKAIDFLNVNANWIVLIWLLIIVYKFIRLSSGLYSIYQLKRKEVSSAGEYWNNRITELCRQLQVNKKVQLLQSHIIGIPAVIGYFKPVILFPAAMLTSMSLSEVEAVLIHELGHIRRKDFLVNMLQNITEIIFFFNPAILWVSSLIKTERENCCDDIAVTYTANKQDYIKALITFQQFSLPATQQLATAFSGEKNHLLNRVKRIIYNNNKTLNNMEKKFLSAGIILVSICLFAFVSNKTRDDKKMKSPILQPAHVNTAETPIVAANKQDINKEKETILQPVSINIKNMEMVSTVVVANDTPVYKVGGGLNLTGETNTSIDGKEYRIVVNNSVVTEMYIDGQKIAAEKIIDYKPILDKCYSKMIANHREELMRTQEEAIRNQEETKRNSEQAMRDREQAMRDRGQVMKDTKQAITPAGPRSSQTSVSAMNDEAKKENENNKKIMQELIEDKIITSGENLSFFLSEDKFIVNDKKQPVEIVKKYFAKYGFKGFNRLYNFRTDFTALPVSPVSPVRADDSNMERIINELITDNIIKDKKEIKSLSLNVTELLVNGVKQPVAIHKKLKDKYVKSETVTLWYETK